MIPADQERLGSVKEGDCFEASLASILELPVSAIPDICSNQDDGTDWMPRLDQFLRPLGYSVAFMANDPPVRPMGYHIASNGGHAVVAKDGVIVHCPHAPSRAGLRQRIVHYYLIIKLGEPLVVEPA